MASKSGTVEKSGSAAYLVREILTLGYTLACLLDEFHTFPIVLSTTVEWLVRRLFVIKEALKLETKDRKAYFDKRLV